MFLHPRFQSGQFHRVLFECFAGIKGHIPGIGPDTKGHHLTEARVERPQQNRHRPQHPQRHVSYLGLASGQISESVIIAGVADFMCWCLGNFERKLVGSCWWLPLDGQAKFGQSSPEGSVNGENRIPEILGFQAQEAIKSIDKLASQSLPETPNKPVASHLFVSSAVNQHRLNRLARNPARYWPIRNRPWDIVVAWRAARSHQRQNLAQTPAGGNAK